MKRYEKQAIEYTEKHGIVDYKLTGSKLIYLVNYKENAGRNAYKRGYKGETYKATVDLKTGIEQRTMLQRYNPKGWINR